MNAPRRQPEQQAPPVQRLQVRYAKRGRARFTSHRDFSRAFERALRRAGVPMAYSSGFNPHPRISFANASPTGAATEAEYLEIGLAEAVDPARVREALDAALPDGLRVLEVVAAPRGALAERLTASEWEMTVPGIERAAMERAVTALLACESLEVERMTKAGLRTFDVRGAVIALSVAGDGFLRLVSAHTTPLVRPDDILQALGRVDGGVVASAPPVVTRRSQGRWDGARIVEPFEDVSGARGGDSVAGMEE